jgi:alkyl hydroperoxide reductase subunit F
MFNLETPGEVEGKVDVCIIGAGPAGMTAAVYAARKRLSTAIVTKDVGGQVAWTKDIENYMGYQYITGRELTGKFEEQVRQFPIPIVIDEVSEIKPGGGDFVVLTRGGRSISARTVVVASGKRPMTLGMPNEQRLIGRGVSYCSTCDGPLFSKKDVAVIGGGNSAVQAAVEMSGIANKVHLVSRSPWRADPVIVEKADRLPNLIKKMGFEPVDVLGDSTVQGLRIKDTRSGKTEDLSVQGVFLEIGLVPNSDFVKGFLDLNESGEILVDSNCRTKILGIFAAGDVTQVHDKQIVIAAGEGAKAALSVHEYLMRK